MPTNIAKFIEAILTPAQDVENALQQLFTERQIDVAVDAQLDVIGKLVGEHRSGLSDDIYRRRIRARIATHKSAGTVNDIVRIADLIVYLDDAVYEVDNQGSATYVLRVTGVAVDADVSLVLLEFLQKATSAGVRVILEHSADDPDDWFKWDTDGQGWDNGKFTDAIS